MPLEELREYQGRVSGAELIEDGEVLRVKITCDEGSVQDRMRMSGKGLQYTKRKLHGLGITDDELASDEFWMGLPETMVGRSCYFACVRNGDFLNVDYISQQPRGTVDRKSAQKLAARFAPGKGVEKHDGTREDIPF